MTKRYETGCLLWVSRKKVSEAQFVNSVSSTGDNRSYYGAQAQSIYDPITELGKEGWLPGVYIVNEEDYKQLTMHREIE